MGADFVLVPRPAFEGLLWSAGATGVAIAECHGLGLGTVQARRGRASDVAQRVRSSFGIELPAAPRRASADAVAFAGIAPMTWLASREGAGNGFAAELRQSLGDAASVSDQSDGLAVLRLTGGSVRDLLARLVPIDVHERAFQVGDVASSVAGHIGVTLWRLEDAHDGTAAFEIAVYRSFAASFAGLLREIVSANGGFPGPLAKDLLES